LKFGTLIANRECIVDVKFWQNQTLFVKVTHMNTEVYLCNIILVMEIFSYRYSKINNFGKK